MWWGGDEEGWTVEEKGDQQAGELQGETPEEAVTEKSEVQGWWETGEEQLPSRPRGGGPCWSGGEGRGCSGREGPTLAVHAHGVEQAGAPELGPQQRHVQRQEAAGLAVLSRGQVQLAAAADSAGGGGAGLPGPALRYGQEAVHEMQFGLLHGVNKGVLPKRKDRPSVGADSASQEAGTGAPASPPGAGWQGAPSLPRPGQACLYQAPETAHRRQH